MFFIQLNYRGESNKFCVKGSKYKYGLSYDYARSEIDRTIPKH